MKLLFLIFIKFYLVFSQLQPNLELISSWKQLDFVFPTAKIRSDLIASKKFVPLNNFPIDVAVDYQGSVSTSRIFVTIPRFSDGIPITLGYIRNPKTDFAIYPYPNYNWHSSNGRNCDQMTSVLRVAIDDCQHMWVLDTGKIGDVQVCPPQLLVFDLFDDSLLKRYKFPATQYKALSLFITPVLDTTPSFNCENTKVYIADVTGPGLIVYDNLLNRSWRIENPSFRPSAAFINFNIAGGSFTLDDGLFGLAVMPRTCTWNSERSLFYHGLASGSEYSVPLSVINNPANWQNNANALPTAFKLTGSRGVQTSAQAFDRDGNLFFVLTNPLVLVCWDSRTAYNRDNIKVVVRNDVTLQFASGLKIVENFDGLEELWIMTIRFQKIAAGTINPSETNYRIQMALIIDLLKGSTKCTGTPLSRFV